MRITEHMRTLYTEFMRTQISIGLKKVLDTAGKTRMDFKDEEDYKILREVFKQEQIIYQLEELEQTEDGESYLVVDDQYVELSGLDMYELEWIFKLMIEE